MANFKRRADAVIAREVNDGVVLLDAEANRIHQLNRTAMFIWEHCDGHTAHNEIAVGLARTYRADEKVVMDDVMETLQELKALNLIVEA